MAPKEPPTHLSMEERNSRNGKKTMMGNTSQTESSSSSPRENDVVRRTTATMARHSRSLSPPPPPAAPPPPPPPPPARGVPPSSITSTPSVNQEYTVMLTGGPTSTTLRPATATVAGAPMVRSSSASAAEGALVGMGGRISPVVVIMDLKDDSGGGRSTTPTNRRVHSHHQQPQQKTPPHLVRRANRKKSKSASATIEAWQNDFFTTPISNLLAVEPPTPKKQKDVDAFRNLSLPSLEKSAGRAGSHGGGPASAAATRNFLANIHEQLEAGHQRPHHRTKREPSRSKYTRASSSRSFEDGELVIVSDTEMTGGGRPSADENTAAAVEANGRALRRANRRKTKSASATIQAWREDLFSAASSPNRNDKQTQNDNNIFRGGGGGTGEPNMLESSPSAAARRISRHARKLSDIPELETRQSKKAGEGSRFVTRLNSARSFEDGFISAESGAAAEMRVHSNRSTDHVAATDRRALRRANRRKTKSASETIQAWRDDLFSGTGTHNKRSRWKNSSERNKKVDSNKRSSITPVDLDMLRNLEHEYSAAARRTTARDKAQRIWACRAGLFSVLFMMIYLIVGVIVLLQLAHDDEDWDNLNTFLFVVYTACTTGFGHISPPDTTAYYLFNTIYLMIGVAAMAIMIAQVFQWMELEAARARDLRKARELAALSGTNDHLPQRTLSRFWRWTDRFMPWFQETKTGSVVSVVLTLTFIGLMGAVPIGLVEGWTFPQMMYFACVAMTTVGYGDIVPETRVGIKLCLAWLPFSVFFSSVYMGSVATWYLNMSARGIRRIQKSLSDDIYRGNTLDRSLTPSPAVARGNAAADDDDDEDSGDDDDDNEDSDDGENSNDDSALHSGAAYDADFLLDDQGSLDDSTVDGGEGGQEIAPQVVFENINSTLTTMQDVLDAIHNNMMDHQLLNVSHENKTVTDSMKFLSLQDDEAEKPCLALRMLVKERMATIIAYEICGGAHHVDVKDTYIVVRIGQWKDVVNKWLIPSGAWKAFRAAALEAMMLAGERALINEGPAALFRLTPDEFHRMFSPLVAAMGDPDTLAGWLRTTDAEATALVVKHKNSGASGKQHKNLTVDGDFVSLPKGAGLIFQSQDS